ncbi:N-acetylmuramoyl-L-alanine amidase [bacterium]|nr:N-acetylmuramoyl-L-alanine amidase [bacterium]
MKYWLLVFAFVLISFPPSVLGQLALDVVYPREGLTLTSKDSAFVFGSTNAPDAQVLVNGVSMVVYPNGAFLGMVPVFPGEFILDCQAITPYDTVSVPVTVMIPDYLTTTIGDSATIDSSYIFPQSDVELQPGDYLQVAVKATPGLQASFSISGLVQNVPMAESPAWKEFYSGESVFGENGNGHGSGPEIAGVYTGVIRLADNVKLDSAAIQFKINGTNGTAFDIVAPGKLIVRHDEVPKIGALNSERTVARTGPRLGYQLFLPAGVKLWITGRRAGFYRARLTDEDHVWVPESNVDLLPSGTPIPSSEVQLVRTTSLPRKSRVKIFLQESLPFKIEQTSNPSKLVISIFGALSNTDWIRYDFGDPSIKLVKWLQPKDDVYQVVVELNHKQQWGYNPYYQGTDLVVDIKRPPEKLELKKLVICIDPGHGPDDGAVGPTRLTEKEANLQLALTLKQRLENKGARVFLTREADHGAALYVRPKLARFMEADILLSVHHNALPDGVNPFLNRGSSTYYYHEQSYPLAAAIQTRLLEKLKLNNFGLFYDNLALCRPPQMPAVLIESAFIMHPEEEAMINTYSYRQKAAEAIVQGIEDFLKASKE